MKEITHGFRWVYPRSPGTDTKMSGWKLHIFGNKTEDSLLLLERLGPLMDKYDMHMKLASKGLYDIAIGDPEDIQYGKAAVFYIPPAVFESNRLQELIDDIVKALGNYDNDGIVQGDKSLGRSIHYRYELSEPIDIQAGIGFLEYARLYRSNDGQYNVEGNPDPFDHISIL